jgi:NTE family protein
MMFDWFRRPAPEPEMRPARLGLALGGGAVRGGAHVGVLAVLEREGIRPDVVAGVSVGAIVGAGIAAGVSAADMMEAFRHASWMSIVTPAWLSRLSMFDSSPLGKLIEKTTAVSDFSDLCIPFAAVACDLLTGRKVVLDSGPVRDAVVASYAIPGLFEPVRRGDEMLVDGGLMVNVPVQTAREMGADYVLGVDIMSLDCGAIEPKDTRDVILLSWEIIQHQTGQGRVPPDLLVTPAVGMLNPWDFARVDDAYAAGVAAMEAALPKLQSDLARGVPVTVTAKP